MTTSTAGHVSAHAHAATFSPKRRKLALTIVALAFVMDLLDSTIVNIAIPSIQHNLGASYTTIQWLIAGYALSFAVLLITGGRMGDVFGYKKMFLWGVAGFTVASLLCGLAWAPGVLIGARLLQGVMAAMMVPQVMSLMQVMYSQEERAGVSGLFGVLGGLAAVLGPVVGGLLIHANLFGLDWRPIFLVNVPVGIFALVAAAAVLPDGKSPHPLHLDWVGTGLIVTALLLLIFPLVQGRELGWPAWTFVMMATSLPFLIAFGWYEQRKMKRDGSPLVVPELFRSRAFVAGIIINMMFEMALGAFFLMYTLLLQAGLGFDVLKAGLTGIPFSIGVGLSIGLLGNALIPKLGRYLMSAGVVVMGAGMLAIGWTAQHFGLGAHAWQFAPALFVTGLGMGSTMAPIFAVVLSGVNVKHAGSASGILNAIQQVGGAVGVAVIGVVFFGLLSSQAAPSVAAVTPQLRSELTALHLPAQAQDQIVQGFTDCYRDRVNQKDSSATPESCKQGEQSASQGQMPPAMAHKLADSVQTAAKQANEHNFVDAFRKSVGLELGLLGVVFALSFALPRRVRREAMAEGM